MKKINNMFFEYRAVDLKGDSFEISACSEVLAEKDFYAKKYLKKML